MVLLLHRLMALYCTVLYCIVWYCTVLYTTGLYCTVLYWLYCTVTQTQGPGLFLLRWPGGQEDWSALLYCTIMNWTELNWTELNCTVLYCTVLYCMALSTHLKAVLIVLYWALIISSFYYDLLIVHNVSNPITVISSNVCANIAELETDKREINMIRETYQF